ncbi:HAD family hydrolase [Streptomyces albidoflavus]
MTLVLWDIDHTLIDTRGVGRELSARAFRETTGLEMQDQAAIDGITEAVIFRETAQLHGLNPSRPDFERFATALEEQHIEHAAHLRERGHALPGAAALLDALADIGVRQTAVTGNVRAVARIKLEVFGLDRHIEWDHGAYGEDADLRPDLVAMALRRAGAAAHETVLIGDTPADVEGGLAHGVHVIAVATGRSTAAELRAVGAHVVFTDLTDTEAVRTAVQAVG